MAGTRKVVIVGLAAVLVVGAGTAASSAVPASAWSRYLRLPSMARKSLTSLPLSWEANFPAFSAVVKLALVVMTCSRSGVIPSLVRRRRSSSATSAPADPR